MSVEFRQRTPSEYLKIIRRRKWLIILPMIAVTSAVVAVVYGLPHVYQGLPDVYESVTLIVVKPSTLPTTVVPTITEDSLTRQLTSIAQVVTSRSSLEPLVNKYELYKAERLRGVNSKRPCDFLTRVHLLISTKPERPSPHCSWDQRLDVAVWMFDPASGMRKENRSDV